MKYCGGGGACQGGAGRLRVERRGEERRGLIHHLHHSHCSHNQGGQFKQNRNYENVPQQVVKLVMGFQFPSASPLTPAIVKIRRYFSHS